MEQALTELKERLGKLTDLRRTQAVLVWDMTVFMPPGGAPTRAAQLGTMEEITHAHVVDDRFGELFAELEPYAASLPHDSDDAALVRVAQRDWNRARRVPAALAVEFARAAAESYEMWVKAREESDFAVFRPSLERIVDLRRQYIECFAPYDDAYDVLLEDYEPGMRTSRSARCSRCSPGTPRARGGAREEDDPFMRGPFPIAGEAPSARRRRGVRRQLGPVSPRQDGAPVRGGLRSRRHPPHEPLRRGRPPFAVHGHARGRPRHLRVGQPDLERTPLCEGVSATLHESQSRLWRTSSVDRSVLALVLPSPAGNVSGAAGRRLARRLPPSRQPRAPLVHPRGR